MSIIINVEQSPLTITPSNAEHIYTLSSTGNTLPDFKYIVQVYFKPQGLNEELMSILKVTPNSYGRAIMDVGEIIRTFLNGNPRFVGETYPYLNLVADENSVITLSDAQRARDYNAFNLSSPGVPNPNLNQLWHIAQYRCVVGCEYTSGNTIITNINPNASYQPDYITIFPGVDNSLVPEPYLPYGSLGSGYTGSANFYQVDNQGWYYYDLFRHVYQAPNAKECNSYTYNNTSTFPVQIIYTTCNNEPANIIVSAFTEDTFCALKGSVVISGNSCVCTSYLLENNSVINTDVYWTDCNGNPQSQTLIPGGGISICACAGSVYHEGFVDISDLGPCDGCNCRSYEVQNTSFLSTTIYWADCDGNTQTAELLPLSGLNLCACQGSITSDIPVEIIDLGSCSTSCNCIGYSVQNISFITGTVYWIDCNGDAQARVLAPTEGVSFCACEGSINSDMALSISIVGVCGDCICKSFSVINTSIITGTVSWIDCNDNPQSRILAPDEGVQFCACEGTISFDVAMEVDDLGDCGSPGTLTDNGLCEGYNPVKECPGPQEFMNAAGKTECAVTQADGQSFTNVRRRMHHPDCPMIVSFLNGKNDYFTNDIFSIAVRGALNHGDPYTYSAECENRTTIALPTTEEPVNSTFKMLNFYLPYNVTAGDTLNAIPTNAQKVCFYGTTYNSNQNTRLNMASATTEILEYWIQPQDCINEPIHILFMNGRGMWDTYTFGKKNTKKLTLERKKYQQETSLNKQLYSRGSSERGQKIFEQDATYSWDCNTWFMDEADTTIMEEIFMSQDVFIITGTTINPQECQSCLNEVRLYQHLIPVVITQKDFTVYEQKYQKIYQYNLTLHWGSVKRYRTQG